MRVVIAGSRGITNYEVVAKAVAASGFQITTVISGTARGVDQLGEEYASRNDLKVERYPAQWNVGGKVDRAAGYKRNAIMVNIADAVIAIWDGVSPGTKSTIDLAYKKGIPCFVYKI